MESLLFMPTLRRVPADYLKIHCWHSSARNNNSKNFHPPHYHFSPWAHRGVVVMGPTHFTIRHITVETLPDSPLVGILCRISTHFLLMIIAFFILGNQWAPLRDAQTCSVAPFFFICGIYACISILLHASIVELEQKKGCDKQKLSISIHL